VTKQNKILAVVGIIALFAGLIWYTTGAMTSKYKFDPKKYFLAAFDEDFDRIEGPLDIKASDDAYDVWMHFKYPHEAKMKHESDFKTGWVAEAAQWFSTRVPDAKGLQDIAHIKFRRRIDNQSAQVTNEWIIYNPRTDEHFYRTWGTSR
jgi:hypothetical protein